MAYNYKAPYQGQQEGVWSKVGDLMPHLAAFKAYYMAKRYSHGGKQSSFRALVDGYNATLPTPAIFPRNNWLMARAEEWDDQAMDAIGRKPTEAPTALTPQEQHSVELSAAIDRPKPPVRSQESRLGTLGDALLDDALVSIQITSDDPEIALKQKTYALNVYNYVTRNKLKQREIDIKEGAGKLANAGFMLDLLNAAATGKLTAENLALLKEAGATVKMTDEQFIEAQADGL